MLIVLSPAKTLDFESPLPVAAHSEPALLEQSAQLVARLREFEAPALERLMDISPALAELNVGRFRTWRPPFSPGNARQAVLAFAGDVYEGLQAGSLGGADLQWAQQHLRILSGLYGVLRPLDLIQPYRLEMGTRLDTARGRDLYAFWGDRIAGQLREAMAGLERPVLVNLASDEYFRSVRRPALPYPVVQPVFQERRGGVWKIISFSAKRARGTMTRFAIDNRITDPQDLKQFDLDGYRHDPAASDDQSWVFRREPA
jgi:cytoplasmic iron level regulating protein YaaA (DUF328/UPF0246 family)